MKIVACSDAHVDVVTNGVVRFDDVANAVEQSVDCAIDEQASLWVFLGDWADPDNSRSFRAASYAIDVAQRLRKHNVEQAWVVGNHDVIEDGHGTHVLSPLKAAGFRVWDKPGSLTLGLNKFGEKNRLDVVALPYSSRATSYDPEAAIRDLAKDRPARTLVVGHLMLEGISPGSETTDMPRGRDVFWPMRAIAECLPEAVVLAGHYHKRQVYERYAVPVQVVGSMERLSHGEESNAPGFLVLDL